MYPRSLQAVGAAAALALAVGCGGAGPASSGPPPNARRVDASKAGAVTGRVAFEGTPPANPALKLDADPYCEKAHPGGAVFETYLVKDGGLENVFVYVKDGLGDYYFDVPSEPVKLDQVGCVYQPHVFGVRAGQAIEISTSDATVHNVHAIAKANTSFNFGLDIPGTKQKRTFKEPEVLVPFKCDVHNWMQAYAGVVSHPYFAVTAGGGNFALQGLPAGTFTIEAVHERLGAQTQSVTIGDKESKALTFTFKATAP